MSKVEWDAITHELQAISVSEKTMSGKFAAQLSVFQKHHLVSEVINIDALLMSSTKERIMDFSYCYKRYQKSTP